MDASKKTPPPKSTKNRRPPDVLKIKSESVYSRTGVKNLAKNLFPEEEDKNKNSK